MHEKIQGEEAKYWIIFKTFFFVLISPIFENKTKQNKNKNKKNYQKSKNKTKNKQTKKQRDKSKFSWLALLFKSFFKIKIQPNWKEKK